MFSKKFSSIIFLILTLIITLFLGSYNFLVVDTIATLPKFSGSEATFELSSWVPTEPCPEVLSIQK